MKSGAKTCNTKMKNLSSKSNTLETTEEWVSELKDKPIKNYPI